MRGATECARRLKLLWSSLRAKLGKVSPPAITDPITQLILGVLSRDTPETKASEGLERLRGMVVDYNELRVIPPIELAAILGDFPDARLKCEDITRALNAVFAREHTVSLDRLIEMPRRDAAAALEKIDGLEPYTRARIRLLGLRHHAIPLDEAMWATARAQHIVDGRCPLLEAQQFLERQVPEENGLEFYALFKRFAWSEMGAAVRKREVPHILSVPPDRTARNMLQLIGRVAPADALPDDDLDEAEVLTAPVGPPPAAEASAPAAGASSAEKSKSAKRSSVKATSHAAPRVKRSGTKSPRVGSAKAGRSATDRKPPARSAASGERSRPRKSAGAGATRAAGTRRTARAGRKAKLA